MVDSTKRNPTKLYAFFRVIPIVGTIVGIVNSYAYRGDLSAGKQFAGFSAYVKILWRPILISMLLTAATLYPWVKGALSGAALLSAELSRFSASPGALIVSVFPSVLGFGIGVYALVFAIPTRLVRDVDQALTRAVENGRREYGSVLVLNADLGYPLVVMTLALAIGVLQQAFADVTWMIVVCWFAFWYAIVSIIEIVGVLFHVGDHAILEKRLIDARDEGDGGEM